MLKILRSNLPKEKFNNLQTTFSKKRRKKHCDQNLQKEKLLTFKSLFQKVFVKNIAINSQKEKFNNLKTTFSKKKKCFFLHIFNS